MFKYAIGLLFAVVLVASPLAFRRHTSTATVQIEPVAVAFQVPTPVAAGFFSQARISRYFESDNNCTSQGVCPFERKPDGWRINFYDQPTREVVIQTHNVLNRWYVLFHETCHGWQGRNLSADDIDLRTWLTQTDEGRTAKALGMDVETAADVCAAHYLNLTNLPVGSYLNGDVPPAWAAWANAVLPSGL